MPQHRIQGLTDSLQPYVNKMVDVTKENFKDVFPSIISDIKLASFVAVDTEFTGLLVDTDFKNELFDDGARRYEKLCSNFRNVTVCQIGLAIFKGVPHTNAYSVTSYNFYLRPHSAVTYDPTFVCQTSSLEFLQKYNFDFNKWLYGGIPFMNSDSAEELRHELLLIAQGEKAANISFELRKHMSKIGCWAATAGEGDTMEVDLKDEGTNRFLLGVMLHHRYEDLWADTDDSKITVKKVASEDRLKLQKQDPECDVFVKKYIDSLLGFTVLFRELANHKKPLVFHNGLLDVMLIYKEFHRHLPRSYELFKSSLHEMFPMIYDTKFLATSLKQKLKNDQGISPWSSTGLSDLADSLRKEKGVLHFPSIYHIPENKYSHEVLLHEAGYDAFLTGFVFLNISHLFAMMQLPSRNHHRPMSPREHVYTLKSYANHIMVQRSNIQYMNLSGSDLKARRPPWIVVEGKGFAKVSPGVVHTALAQYGDLDVLPRNRQSVLVAATSWECTREILRNLSGDGPFKATTYNRFKHSSFTRTLAWSGALISTGLSAWLVYTTMRKSPR